MNAKEKLEALTGSQQCCGACGQFIPKNELDEEGLFHSSKFCDVAIEEELNTYEAIKEVISIIKSINPFTVADMKKALEGLSDDTQILVGGHDGSGFDWANLSHTYESPATDETRMALGFYTVNNYDGRQF